MNTLTQWFPSASPCQESVARRMLNKVPEVTLYFWIIKILCTTVGETAADYVNDTLGFGLTNTSYVTAALLIAVLVGSIKLTRPTEKGGRTEGEDEDAAAF